MRRVRSYFVTAIAGGALALMATASAPSAADTPSGVITKIPAGYRDWKLISVAHEEANLNSFAAVLGNDVAVKAYRAVKLRDYGRIANTPAALDASRITRSVNSGT